MAQVSLALLLLVAAGLMVSTFGKLVLVDPGFRPEQVLLARLDFRNGNPARERRVWEVLERVRSLPGVHSAGTSAVRPLCNCEWTEDVTVPGYTPKSAGDSSVFMQAVSEGYFPAMGTALVAGRDFSAFDTPASPPVAIVNRTMAKKFFGGANPLGRYYRKGAVKVEIVGVVKDAKLGSLREGSVPAVYTARRQDPWADSDYHVEIRAAGGDPTALIAGVKRAVNEVDRDVVLEFSTLSGRLHDSLQREQLLAVLAGFFGLLALLLSTLGLYGVMSREGTKRSESAWPWAPIRDWCGVW